MQSYFTIQSKLEHPTLKQLETTIKRLLDVDILLNSVISEAWPVIEMPDNKEMKIDLKIKMLQDYSQKLYEQTLKKYNLIVDMANTNAANIKAGQTFLELYANLSYADNKLFLDNLNKTIESAIREPENSEDFQRKAEDVQKLIRLELVPESALDLTKTAYFFKKISTHTKENFLIDAKQIEVFFKMTKDIIQKIVINRTHENEIKKAIGATDLSKFKHKIFIKILNADEHISALSAGRDIHPSSQLAYLFLNNVYTEEEKESNDKSDKLESPDTNPIIQVLNARNLSHHTKCEVLKALIRLHHPCLNRLDNKGYTPLEYLLSSPNSELIQSQGPILELVDILVQSGAYLGLTNGHSPLHLAEVSKLNEASAIVKYLLEAGADPLPRAIVSNDEKIEGASTIKPVKRESIYIKTESSPVSDTNPSSQDGERKRQFLGNLDVMSVRSVLPVEGFSPGSISPSTGRGSRDMKDEMTAFQPFNRQVADNHFDASVDEKEKGSPQKSPKGELLDRNRLYSSSCLRPNSSPEGEGEPRLPTFLPTV